MSTGNLGGLPRVPSRWHERQAAKSEVQLAITRAIMEHGLSNSEAVALLSRMTYSYAQQYERPPQPSDES